MLNHYIVEENIFVVIKILKHHIKDCFKINGKQKIKILRKVNMLNSNILKEK